MVDLTTLALVCLCVCRGGAVFNSLHAWVIDYRIYSYLVYACLIFMSQIVLYCGLVLLYFPFLYTQLWYFLLICTHKYKGVEYLRDFSSARMATKGRCYGMLDTSAHGACLLAYHIVTGLQICVIHLLFKPGIIKCCQCVPLRKYVYYLYMITHVCN